MTKRVDLVAAASEEGDALPEGWARARLADGLVLDVQPGFACGTHHRDATGVAHLRPMNVSQDGRIALSNVKYVPAAEAERNERRVRRGDVLFNNTNSPELVGKTAYYGLTEPRAFSNHMTRLRCRPELLDPEFCAFVLHQLWREGYFEAVCNNHVSQASISRSALIQTSIPLPPPAEQRRIVSKTETVLAEVNAARDRLAGVPAILARFRQAVLAAACSGSMTKDWRNSNRPLAGSDALRGLAVETAKRRVRRGVPDAVEMPEALESLELPPTWVAVSSAELLRSGALLDLKDGNHGANHPKVSEFTSTGLPFITAAQVRDYGIDYDEAPKVSGKVRARLRVGFAEPGDAILTHKGSVGRAALNTRSCVLTPQTTYYRCDPEAIDPSYLVYYFTAPQFFSQLAAVMSQTTRDFVPISEQYRLFLLLPPPAEQKEIVRRIDNLFGWADSVSRRLRAASSRADRLTESILAKAFRGELVPTEADLARAEDRDFEAASFLLKRIGAGVRASDPGSDNARSTRQGSRSRQDERLRPENVGRAPARRARHHRPSASRRWSLKGR